jgi:hypothetical protein
MRMRTLGSLGVGVLFFNITLSAQAPAPLPGTSMPGPPAPRPQAPAAGTVRDNAPTPTGTGKILGRVVSADNGMPLRRAQVQIVAGEQRLMKKAITDAEGRYSFGDLPAGRYSVSVSRNGYVALQFGQQRPFESGKPLELANGQTAEKIDFALPRGGVIAGRITDEVGEPLAGAGVRAMRYQYQPDGRRRLTPAGTMGGPFSIQTDDLGQFRLYGLMPGSYVVSASMNMNTFTPPGMTVGSGSNDGGDGYAPTYYPGTASETEAQAVTVSIGQEASAFFSMVPARLSKISGVIRNSQGRPPTSVMLMIRAKDNMGFGSGAMVGSDGAFAVQNIPPGEYFLDVRPNMRGPAVSAATPATEPEFASVPLTVAGQDITGLFVTTGAGGIVSGRVIVDNGTLQAAIVPGQPLRVFFSGAEPFSSMPMGAMEPGDVNASGEFELKGVIGKGTFRTGGTSFGLKSVTLEGRDITDTPYDIKPGARVGGLEITLTKSQTTLSGSVQSGLGAAKDYVVVIFPSNLREGDLSTRFIRTVRPDQEGKYQTKGLPAGDYFAIAMEVIEQGEQWDPAFHDRVKPRATNFRLNEGQTLTLDLRLQAAP